MVSMTSAGSTIGISAALPATEDETGYAALTFTTIGGVESIPAMGATVAVNSFQPLNGPVEKHKGPVNYGSLQIPMAYDAADAGQILVRTAAAPDNNALYAICVTYSDGSKDYSQGRVFGAPKTIGSATGVAMMNPTIELVKKVVTVEA